LRCYDHDAERLDNGRLVVVVGVAPLRPAEFVIFGIGQWTHDQSQTSF